MRSFFSSDSVSELVFSWQAYGLIRKYGTQGVPPTGRPRDSRKVERDRFKSIDYFQSSPKALERKRLSAASRSEIRNRLILFDGLICATIRARTQLVSVRTDIPMYLAAAAGLRYPGFIVTISFFFMTLGTISSVAIWGACTTIPAP